MVFDRDFSFPQHYFIQVEYAGVYSPRKNCTCTRDMIRKLIAAPRCQEKWRRYQETGQYAGRGGGDRRSTIQLHGGSARTRQTPARLIFAIEHQNWQILPEAATLFTDKIRLVLTTRDRCERIWRRCGERAAAWSVIPFFPFDFDSKSRPLWVNGLVFHWLNTF